LTFLLGYIVIQCTNDLLE